MQNNTDRGNEPAFPRQGWLPSREDIKDMQQEHLEKFATFPQQGISKREYFAAMEKSEPPESFWNEKLKEYCLRDDKKIKTERHPSLAMNYKEIAETVSAWRALMADALLNQLNSK